MTDREFVCLDCGTAVETFLDPCPDCGGRQFESKADTDESTDEKIADEIAKLTRPVNPMAPATGD